MRYRISKGICEGLHSLHHINIMHLDLKPSNILMDDNLIPKITDFSLSRSFEELQTRVGATKVLGTLGYLAPEFSSHIITHKFDLYSLGVIIIEMLTGGKECHGIENILESWGKRLELSQGHPQLEQIRVCAEIGMECTNIDPAKRPVSMKHVMDRLAETGSTEYSHELLDDHLLEYRIYPELSETIPCSLHLTNKTDEHVAFRLMERSSESLSYYSVNPMYGGVLPRSTCTLIGTTVDEMLAQETGTDLVLQSSISGDKNIVLLKSELTYNSNNNIKAFFQSKSELACNIFFEEAKELGHAVHEVSLEAVYTLGRGETTSELAVRPTIIMKPIYEEYHEILYCLDAHPTEPWIVLGLSDGNVSVWNYESKTTMDSFKIPVEPVFPSALISSDHRVCSIKFHATKKWIVAVTSDECIHVYDCACVKQIQKITSFSFSFRGPGFYDSYSVGIHPTKPYVVSASMELWDGENGWRCTHTFGTGGQRQVAFNPEEPNSFASVQYNNCYVEVWSLDSPKPDYTLNGHSAEVNCLNFFKRGDRQYLITGSDDCTAKIWDWQEKACIHTLEAFMSPIVHVISLPGRPYLVTCTENGTIHVWSSTDFRLKTTVNFSGGGHVKGLVCFMGSRSD